MDNRTMGVTLTPIAAMRIKQRAGSAAPPRVRFGVRKTGCSGFSYVVEYAEQPVPGDRVFRSHGVEIVVDPESIAMLDGVRIDFRKTGVSEMFHFDNPNAAASCGCGESFTVDESFSAAPDLNTAISD